MESVLGDLIIKFFQWFTELNKDDDYGGWVISLRVLKDGERIDVKVDKQDIPKC